MQTKFPIGSLVKYIDADLEAEIIREVGPAPAGYKRCDALRGDLVWFTCGTWAFVDSVTLVEKEVRKAAPKTECGVLAEVINTLKERGTQNGYDKDKERSAAKVAEVFNALTGRDLTEQEAWTFMICLKLVRNQNKPRRDNIVDLIGYTALLGESQGEAI